MNFLHCDFEIKMATDDTGRFSGYASVWGVIDSQGDIVAKGAFKDSLKESKSANDWPAMLLQHGGPTTEDQLPVGIWTHMEENETGLRVEGKLANTKRGKEIYELLKMKPRPALNGLSIGFRAKDFTMGGKNDKARRILNAVDLVEVSLVTAPSNSRARVTSVKSRLEDKPVDEAEVLKQWQAAEIAKLREANRTGRYGR